METNKTLAEVYKNSSNEVKELLETKFSNEELGVGYILKAGDIVVWNGERGFIGVIIGKDYNFTDCYKTFNPFNDKKKLLLCR